MKSESGASRAETVRFALDTNCLVALVAEWHPRHRTTVAAYERRLAGGQQPVVAGDALLECFSVLTRLPGAVRVPAESAERVLTLAFAERAELASLDPGDHWLLIRALGQSGRGGGIIYDAAIALASLRAGARELLTWNVKDMARVAPAGLVVMEPEG